VVAALGEDHRSLVAPGEPIPRPIHGMLATIIICLCCSRFRLGSTTSLPIQISVEWKLTHTVLTYSGVYPSLVTALDGELGRLSCRGWGGVLLHGGSGKRIVFT
jgi:hypothetical protein